MTPLQRKAGHSTRSPCARGLLTQRRSSQDKQPRRRKIGPTALILRPGNPPRQDEESKRNVSDSHKPFTVVPGKSSHKDTDEEGDAHGNEPHGQGYPCPLKHPCEHIPPKFIGAEEVDAESGPLQVAGSPDSGFERGGRSFSGRRTIDGSIKGFVPDVSHTPARARRKKRTKMVSPRRRACSSSAAARPPPAATAGAEGRFEEGV